MDVVFQLVVKLLPAIDLAIRICGRGQHYLISCAKLKSGDLHLHSAKI